MDAFLNAHADWLATAFWACMAGIVILLGVAAIEWCMAAAMRRRARQREALRRYAESIVDRCHWKNT